MVTVPEPAPVRTGLLRRASRSPVILGTAAVVLPIVVTIIAVSGRPWFATGDFAHTELLVRAIPEHPPLVGVAARVGGGSGQGSTPGPSMAYLLAVPYRIGGASGLSLLWSTALLHIVGVVAAVLLAKRNGGTAAALLLAGTLAVMTRSLVPDFFVQPWNVWVPLYAFLAFLMLVWGLSRGDVVLLPWAVLVGSHCVQTHVSYTLLVTGLLGASIVVLVVLATRTELVPRKRLVVSALVAFVCFVVAWLPPLIEQYRPGTGNLRKLFDEFSSPAEPYVGLWSAAKAMAGELNLLGPWVTGPGKVPIESPNLAGFLGFVLLVAAGGWFAVRRRDREVLTLQAVLGLAVVIGLASTARIFGTFFDYVIRWMWPLAAAITMASLWSLWRAASERVATIRSREGRAVPAVRFVRAAPAIGTAAFLVVTVLGVASAAEAETTYPRDSRMTQQLSAQLAERLDRSAVYRLEHHDPVALGSAAFGIVLEMEKRGFHVGIDEAGRAGAMPFRVVSRDRANAVLLYVVGDAAIAQLRADPAAVEVAYTDPRSDDEQLLSAALLRELQQRMCAAGLADLIPRLDEQYGFAALEFLDLVPPDEKALLRQVGELRLPGAVFEVDPSSPLFELSVRSGQETCRLLEES
ncbi:MAG: hypothetical protein AB7Q42_15810 [Acidimicrobiia bacterium]